MVSDSDKLAKLSSQMQETAGLEEKLRLGLDFMRERLSLAEGASFEEFWKAKELCLPLFKELPAATARAALWAEYAELSRQQRHVKTLVDQEAAFATEQIELALQALEGDVGRLSALAAEGRPFALSFSLNRFASIAAHYVPLQGEIELYSVFAQRIQALREEVIKTGMRARLKNQFLERLSKCGDLVFPKRKDLCEQLSSRFSADIDSFVAAFEGRREPFYVLREEIKELQAMAKEFTLNSSCFRETRKKLSALWDKIKEQDKLRKEAMAERSAATRKNVDLVAQKITELDKKSQEEGFSFEALNQEIEAVLDTMREVELGRDEVRGLKDALFSLRKPFLEKAQKRDLENVRQEEALLAQKKERLSALEAALRSLLEKAPHAPFEELTTVCKELSEELGQIEASALKRREFERLLKRIQEIILDRQEQGLLELPEDQREALQQLKTLLKQRRERRSLLKQEVDASRKELSISGLDFEKAWDLQQQLESDKALLEKAETAVEEVEEQIAKLRQQTLA